MSLSMSIVLSVHLLLSTCLFIHLSIHLSIHESFFPSINPSLFLHLQKSPISEHATACHPAPGLVLKCFLAPNLSQTSWQARDIAKVLTLFTTQNIISLFFPFLETVRSRCYSSILWLEFKRNKKISRKLFLILIVSFQCRSLSYHCFSFIL